MFYKKKKISLNLSQLQVTRSRGKMLNFFFVVSLFRGKFTTKKNQTLLYYLEMRISFYSAILNTKKTLHWENQYFHWTVFVVLFFLWVSVYYAAVITFLYGGQVDVENFTAFLNVCAGVHTTKYNVYKDSRYERHAVHVVITAYHLQYI